MKPNKNIKIKTILLILFLIIIISSDSYKSTKTKTKTSIESDEYDMITLNNLFGSKFNGGESFLKSLENESQNYPPHTIPISQSYLNKENFYKYNKGKYNVNTNKNPISEFNFIQKEIKRKREKENSFKKYENSLKKIFNEISSEEKYEKNQYKNKNENKDINENLFLSLKENEKKSKINSYKENENDNPEKEKENQNQAENEDSENEDSEKEVVKEKDLIWSGYLQIKSDIFKRESLFPAIETLDKKGNIVMIRIKTDNENYRLNDLHKNNNFIYINENYNDNNNKYKIDPRDFWFKLNKKFLFYSINPYDVNILQTFPLNNIRTIEPIQKKINENSKNISWFFALIEHRTLLRYQLESSNKNKIVDVYCKIKEQLNIKDSIYCNNLSKDLVLDLPINTVIEKFEIDPEIILPKKTKFCNENWNYDNHGDDWECGCKEGNQQSPINLPKISEAIDSPVTPIFNFHLIPALNKKSTIDGYIKKNTYTKIKLEENCLRIIHPNMGKITEINGSIYEAEEITFHTPSEHLIDGRRYDMEMQVVFYGSTKGDIAKNVILSFLFEKKNGYYNRFLDDIDFYNLPNYEVNQKDILNDLFIPKVFYSITGQNDIDDKLAVLQPFSFYTYEGSITNPPCTENTIHYINSMPIPIAQLTLNMAKEAIMKKDVKIEKWDFEINKKILDQEIIKVENYRNIQDLNNRRVFHYDHNKYYREFTQIKNEVKEKEYHYEKILTEASEYIFVPGKNPSGIPGSFLIDKKEAYGTEDNKIISSLF
jgi:carbonic anhydrase